MYSLRVGCFDRVGTPPASARKSRRPLRTNTRLAPHVAALMEPIIATASVTGELLGELSPELRAKMTGDVPQLFRIYRSM